MNSRRKNQSGFVLITGIIFLLVVAVAAISSMQVTNLDYKMSANSVFKDMSFQASESGRTAVGDAVYWYVYERSWDNVDIHSSLVKADDYNPLGSNGESEDMFDASTLIKDMDFQVAATTDTESIDADIYIIRANAATGASGAGLQQLAGYRGAGKGAASSGSVIYFELRSKGFGNGGAETITASEYRTYIQ